MWKTRDGDDDNRQRLACRDPSASEKALKIKDDSHHTAAARKCANSWRRIATNATKDAPDAVETPCDAQNRSHFRSADSLWRAIKETGCPFFIRLRANARYDH